MERDLKSLPDEALFEGYIKRNDTEMRNELIARYAYIAEILSKKFYAQSVDQDDLFQVGMLAIIKALQRFDISKNIRLQTYLTHCVSGEIKNYFRDKADVIKAGRDLRKVCKKAQQAAAEILKMTGRYATPQAIAEKIGYPLEKVIEALEYTSVSVPLDAEVQGSGALVSEIIPDTSNRYEGVDNKDFFEFCMGRLNETEQNLIRMRYVEELSQSETAKRLNVSQMLVSRLERKILLKLRQYV